MYIKSFTLIFYSCFCLKAHFEEWHCGFPINSFRRLARQKITLIKARKRNDRSMHAIQNILCPLQRHADKCKMIFLMHRRIQNRMQELSYHYLSAKLNDIGKVVVQYVFQSMCSECYFFLDLIKYISYQKYYISYSARIRYNDFYFVDSILPPKLLKAIPTSILVMVI